MTERAIICIALFICIAAVFIAAIIADCIIKIKQAECSRPVNWYLSRNLNGWISRSNGPEPRNPEEYEQINAVRNKEEQHEQK